MRYNRELDRVALAARDSWGLFLASRIAWSVFATLTFRHGCPAEAVEKSLRGWLREWATMYLSRACARDFSRGRGGYWVAGIEPHESGRLHAHVLISDVAAKWDRRVGHRLWFVPHGVARIEKVLDTCAVSSYISKYVLGPTSEIVVGRLPSWSKLLDGAVGSERGRTGGVDS